MRKAYICSPYRAMTQEQLDNHIDYAQYITKKALIAGIAPITPHLYMTQCLDESIAGQRNIGLAAGMELLNGCDFIIVGVKYGISEGMRGEIQEAERMGLDVVNADKLQFYLLEKHGTAKEVKEEWRISTEQ